MFISIGAYITASAGIIIFLRRMISPLISMTMAWQIIFLLLSGLFCKVFGYYCSIPGYFFKLSRFMWCLCPFLAGGNDYPGCSCRNGRSGIDMIVSSQGMATESDLLLAVIMGQLVTISGDLLYFSLSFLIPKSPILVPGLYEVRHEH